MQINENYFYQNSFSAHTPFVCVVPGQKLSASLSSKKNYPQDGKQNHNNHSIMKTSGAFAERRKPVALYNC